MTRYVLFATNLYALPILRPMAQAIVASGREVAWFVVRSPAAYMESDEQLLRDLDQVEAFAPRAVFSARNWVACFFPGIKVQAFHGFSVDKGSPERGHFRVRGLFDLYCTQGLSTTARKEETERLPAANGRKVCLYAATFTVLYEQISQQVASGDRYWLLTPHPKTDLDVISRYRALSGPNARFFEAHELTRLMSAADMLVSDTFSFVFEILVQSKPFVTSRNRSPKSCMIDSEDPNSLEAALRKALDAPPALIAEIEAFATRTHACTDGRASERVLAAAEDLLDGRLGKLAPKPRNLLRKLQGRLHYRRRLNQSMWA